MGLKEVIVVLPKPLKAKVLQIAHNRSVHFGISDTRSLINRQFSWPFLAADVKTYVQSCKTCRMNSKQKPSKAPLQKPDLITECIEKQALDVVGPLDRSKQGYAYLLTAMDLATHFAYTLPMKAIQQKGLPRI